MLENKPGFQLSPGQENIGKILPSYYFSWGYEVNLFVFQLNTGAHST